MGTKGTCGGSGTIMWTMGHPWGQAGTTGSSRHPWGQWAPTGDTSHPRGTAGIPPCHGWQPGPGVGWQAPQGHQGSPAATAASGDTPGDSRVTPSTGVARGQAVTEGSHGDKATGTRPWAGSRGHLGTRGHLRTHGQRAGDSGGGTRGHRGTPRGDTGVGDTRDGDTQDFGAAQRQLGGTQGCEGRPQGCPQGCPQTLLRFGEGAPPGAGGHPWVLGVSRSPQSCRLSPKAPAVSPNPPKAPCRCHPKPPLWGGSTHR